MSSLMIAAAALGLGVYTVSLGGEWTEAELKEKRMVSSALLEFCCDYRLQSVIPRSIDIRNRSFDEVGTNGSKSHRRV